MLSLSSPKSLNLVMVVVVPMAFVQLPALPLVVIVRDDSNEHPRKAAGSNVPRPIYSDAR